MGRCVPLSNILVILSRLAYTLASVAQWDRLSHMITVQLVETSYSFTALCVFVSLLLSSFHPPSLLHVSEASLSLPHKYEMHRGKPVPQKTSPLPAQIWWRTVSRTVSYQEGHVLNMSTAPGFANQSKLTSVHCAFLDSTACNTSWKDSDVVK